jgi:hypothetical protein
MTGIQSGQIISVRQGRMRIAAVATGASGDGQCAIFQTLFRMYPGEIVLELHGGETWENEAGI